MARLVQRKETTNEKGEKVIRELYAMDEEEGIQTRTGGSQPSSGSKLVDWWRRSSVIEKAFAFITGLLVVNLIASMIGGLQSGLLGLGSGRSRSYDEGLISDPVVYSYIDAGRDFDNATL